MAQPDSRGQRIRLLFVLGALSAFGPLSMDTYLPALPEIGRDLHAGEGTTQLTMSACIIGLALGQLVIGPISDTIGRRRPLIAGVASFAVLSLACAFAPNVGVLMALRLLQGLAGSAGIVLSLAIVRDLYGGGRDSARMLSRLVLVSGSAPVVAPILGAQLLRVVSWRGVFVVLAAIGVVLLIGAISLPESHPVASRRSGGLRQTRGAFSLLIHSRPFIGYTAGAGLAGSALFCYISASPFVVEDSYGHSAQLFSLVFAVNSVGIIVAGQVGARLVRRTGPAALFRAGQAVQFAAGAVLLIVVATGHPPLLFLLVPLFFIVASVGLVIPNGSALALAPHGEIAGAASAQIGAFQFLLGALVSPLAGLGGRSSTLPLGITIAVLTLVGFVIGRAMSHRDQNGRDDSATRLPPVITAGGDTAVVP